MTRRLWIGIVALGCLLVTPAAAQRVQFPTNAGTAPWPAPTTAPVTPMTPQPTLPAYDPYNASSLGAPPMDVPYTPAPAANPYALQPSIGNQPSSGLFTGGPPVRWESGTYDYPNSDGSVARLQRFLQQISFEQTWLAGEHRPQELSINRTELSATFGIPIFYNPDTPLLLTPGFAFNFLQGPVEPGADLPPRLYDAYLDAAWHPRFSDWFHADLGFRTGVWTDFEEVNSDSVRLLGRGMAVLAFSPRFDLLAGVWYIDRNDVKLLPAGGFHWRPNAEWDAYVVFPNPKIRKRLVNIGTSQWWYYFAGEYGGGRWTVERDGGLADDIDINDIRVIFGFEWETQTQARGHIEVGYVWDREILYAASRSPVSLKLDDTVMVRAGFDF